MEAPESSPLWFCPTVKTSFSLSVPVPGVKVGCSVQREETRLQVSDALSVFGKASLTSHRELHSFIPASYLWTLSHVLQVRDKDSCFFTLKCFDDSLHHFKVSPKSDPEATAKVGFTRPSTSQSGLFFMHIHETSRQAPPPKHQPPPTMTRALFYRTNIMFSFYMFT